MASGDQRMIAHMAVDMRRHLYAIADILVVAPAEFDHFVPQHGVWEPSYSALEHVVVVELAGHPSGAEGLWAIAHLDGEPNHFDGSVPPSVVPIGERRIGRRLGRLD